MIPRFRRSSAAVAQRPAHRRRLERAAAAVALASMLMGTWATTARAEDGPGETDPLGGPSKYSMFRSDKLFTMLPVNDSRTWLNTYAPSSDLSQLTPSSNAFGTDYSQSQAAASGRILSPDKDQVVLARPDGNGNIKLSLLNNTGGNPDYNLPYADTETFSGKPYPLNIEVGDIDNVTDEDGNFHDEVVVAYPQKQPNGQTFMRVVVLDYTNASLDDPQPTAATSWYDFYANEICPAQICPTFDTLSEMAIGDFDGDGKKDIALAVQTDTEIALMAFGYTNDGKGNREFGPKSIATVSQDTLYSVAYAFMGSFDMVAGDFDGDGKDELAAAVAEKGPPASPLIPYPTLGIWLKVFRADDSLKMTMVTNTIKYSAAFDSTDPIQRPSLQLVSGLFKLDERNGFGLARRQLALAFNPIDVEDDTFPSLTTFQLDSSLNLAPLFPAFRVPYVGVTGSLFSLTAGGFQGNTDLQNNALWPLAFAALDRDNKYTVGLIKVGANGLRAAAFNQTSGPQWNANSTWQPVVVPYDQDGKAVYLGAPLHITLQNVLSTDYVLNEPPKMTYWDESAQKVINVSRYPDFNVELEDEKGLDFKSSSKDTTNWSVGGSAAVSAGAEAKAGGNYGLLKAGSSVCAQLTLKASYNYDSSSASDTSKYNTRDVGVQGSTAADDYLQGRYQTIDVWRYRVYGIKDTQTNTNTFYDLMLPGSTQDFAGGGLNYDWYQPTHENGNILSYPRYLNGNNSNVPADLGSFTLPDGTVKTEPMIAASQQAWDATTKSKSLKWTTSTITGTETEYKHTINASLDFKTAFKAEAEVPFAGGASVNGSLELTANYDRSWSGATTSENSTNGSKEITLNVWKDKYANQPGDNTQAYFFWPVFYTAKDGTIKVSYAVDPLGSKFGSSTWQARFGGKPDPALNLPGRFRSSDGEEWEPNGLWTQRKMIRGFMMTSPNATVTNPNSDPITGDYPKLVYAPVDGDKVRVAVRVYNYSLDTPAQNVRVRFQAVKFNDSTLQEIGERVDIGDTLVSLGSMSQNSQMNVAAINWDTTGFGGTTGTQEYRIYVVLNPKDNNPQYIANEIYPAEPAPVDWKPGEDADTQEEGTFDPGQNNEGFGVAYVSAKPGLIASPNPTGVDVHMTSDSLAVLEPDGTFQTQQVQATFGKPILVRATVFSDKASTEFNHLLLYDGDPANGGRMIADKQVFTGDTSDKGASVWVQWRPTNPGGHTLYAKVLEDPSDPTTGNHFDTLKVQVESPVTQRQIYVPIISRGSGTIASTPNPDATTPAVSAPKAAPQAVLAAEDGANCGGGGGEGGEKALASQQMASAPDAGVLTATDATTTGSAASMATDATATNSAASTTQESTSAVVLGSAAGAGATRPQAPLSSAGSAPNTAWQSTGVVLIGLPLAQASLTLRRRYRRHQRRDRRQR